MGRLDKNETKDIKGRFDIYYVSTTVEYLPGQTIITHLSMEFCDYDLAVYSRDLIRSDIPNAKVSGWAACGSARDEGYIERLRKIESRDQYFKEKLGLVENLDLVEVG